MSAVFSLLLSWLQEEFLSLLPVNSTPSSQNVRPVHSLTQGTLVCTELRVNLGGIIYTIVFLSWFHHKMNVAWTLKFFFFLEKLKLYFYMPLTHLFFGIQPLKITQTFFCFESNSSSKNFSF